MTQQKNHKSKGAKPPSRANSIRRMLGVVVVVAGVVALSKYSLSPGSNSPSAGPQNEKAATPSPFAPTLPNQTSAPNPAPDGMVWIPGGEFSMGSDAAS